MPLPKTFIFLNISILLLYYKRKIHSILISALCFSSSNARGYFLLPALRLLVACPNQTCTHPSPSTPFCYTVAARSMPGTGHVPKDRAPASAPNACRYRRIREERIGRSPSDSCRYSPRPVPSVRQCLRGCRLRLFF